ncbi:hypothetical protein PV761_02545 [Arthrobacter sp. CC3]|uniref:hypothetical protein n=1 Tax=Arthrobacter sp. CC3 TaxID=3029185 RepID=UPI0032635AD8
MDDEELWRLRLQKVVDAVRSWEVRIERPDEIAARSSIDRDDEGLPGHPVRSAAWYGLIAAVDCLGLVADLSKELTLRPSSMFTSTRAALLGASQAVWVLTGTREVRQLRALSVANDEYKNHRGFVNDYAKDPFIRQGQPAGMVAELEDLAQKLTDKMHALKELRQGKPYAGDFSSTVMMREAAAHLSSQPETDEWLRLALGYEWRMASAAAHARSWPMHVRKTERESLPDGGEIRRMSASLAEVVQSCAAAALMTSEAWRLWDLRGTRHV